MKRIVIIGLLLVMTHCSTNVFEEADKKDPGEKATKYLETDKPQLAIDLLEPLVASDPTNYRLTALLAAAYAQNSGIETFKLIKNLIKKPEGEDGEEQAGGAIGAMFTVLPEATQSNIAGLAKAISTMELIPASERKSADTFLLSLYISASVSLQAKSFDKDGDGKLTIEELQTLTEQDAENLINSISSAADLAKAIGGVDGQGAESSAASEKVQGVFDAIQAQDGADNSEKLKNYLATKNTSTEETSALR